MPDFDSATFVMEQTHSTLLSARSLHLYPKGHVLKSMFKHSNSLILNMHVTGTFLIYLMILEHRKPSNQRVVNSQRGCNH